MDGVDQTTVGSQVVASNALDIDLDHYSLLSLWDVWPKWKADINLPSQPPWSNARHFLAAVP